MECECAEDDHECWDDCYAEMWGDMEEWGCECDDDDDQCWSDCFDENKDTEDDM